MAIDVDDAARAVLASLRSRVSRRLDAAGALRWAPPDQLHLTLAFIGEVQPPVGAAVIDGMTSSFARAPFTLALGGLGVFPSRGAPRVLWIGSTAGARETIDLQRDVAGRLEAIGIALESRPFHPHLTLGRWRESRERDRRAVDAIENTGEAVRVEVDHVTLYRSYLSPDGARHEALAAPRLVGP